MAQNIEMQCKQSDGSYETLLPKSQASLLEINNTDLGNHLGGNTTVEGSLDYLSRMYAYWWKRDIITPVYGLKWTYINGGSGSSKTYYFARQSWSREQYGQIEGVYRSYYYTNYYFESGNTLTVDASGNLVRGSDWSGTSVYWKFYTDGDEILSETNPSTWNSTNYVYYDGEYYSASTDGSTPNKTVRMNGWANNSTGWKMSLNGNDGLYKITTQVVRNDTTTDYVYSFSRDAYPDSGTVGNYTYTYLGIPFENAMKDGPK